jgi:hypothetical protein
MRFGASALEPPGPDDQARAVQGEVRGVEEIRLARLRLDRVEAEAADGCAMALRRHAELQFHAARVEHDQRTRHAVEAGSCC